MGEELARAQLRWTGARLPCAGTIELRCRNCGAQGSFRFRCAGQCDARCTHGEQAASSLLRMIPRVPVRHWVLTVPAGLRRAAATDQKLAALLCRTMVGEVARHLRQVCAGPDELVEAGAASLVHRAGSALDLNVHVHALVLDGVYVQARGDAARFVPLPDEPSEAQLEAITRGIRARLRAKGASVAALADWSVSQTAAEGPAASSAIRRIRADGPVAARRSKLAAGSAADGFGVHAMERVDASARGVLHRLANYLVRAKVVLADLRPGEGDRVIQQLAVPWSDGTTHVEFSSRELARRLVALTPSERIHRVSYHGVLAPRAAARWRLHAQQLRLVPDDPPAPRVRAQPPNEVPAPPPRRFHPSTCGRCGGRLRVVAVEERADPALFVANRPDGPAHPGPRERPRTRPPQPKPSSPELVDDAQAPEPWQAGGDRP